MARELLFSHLKDKVVYSRNMVALGTVRDVQIDTAEMRVTHLVLQVEKQIAKELLGKLIVIRHAKARLPTSLVESVKDAIILKKDADELKGSIESV